jgi:twitching motility protein PilT
MDISNLLEIALEAGASDLHLSTGLPPILRIDGELQTTSLPHHYHLLINLRLSV